MDSQTLKTFLTLANVKNFTQTARLMYIAQSTVTNRIAELEREVGKPLFIRSKKNISLTREGLIFLDYARRILDLQELSIRELNSPAFSRTPLRIGTTNTIYECYLAPVLLEMLKKDSRYAVNLVISHSVSLLQSLQDGLLDLVFTYERLQKAGYRCHRFRTDKLLLVASPANARMQPAVRKEELPGLNYLFCNFALQEVGQFIRELFPPFYQFPFEIDNSTKLVQYLQEGIGCSFLPEGLVQPYLEEGSLQAIRLIDFEAPRISCYQCFPEGREPAFLL
ncbi:LysR family transcriptional regulator [Lachnoclostridium sp. An131]|uniref:LysR family transcriptional regulator n=1 Tax=Lachnoclostridium sp. An131 TaxID=1965555 RepID=UPI000B38BAB1|nr:LysR family transcriptional regulator [Lachnoclostridium sp. An131]OUQ28406.1 LysR family transcriptional regulator [Lachnoclostridium sp. An131]